MQVSEVYNLMQDWRRDPCFDLEVYAYSAEYAPYRNVMLEFIRQTKLQWGINHKEHKEDLRKLFCPFTFSSEKNFHCETEDCALWNPAFEQCCFRVQNSR